MSELEGLPWLLLWGMAVGVDLVSFPQGLFNRPVVAAGVAGALLGDPANGLLVGVLLELFAMDVLPIGASRYPDFGPGAVVAAAMIAGGDARDLLGPAALLGLLLAVVGGRALDVLRRLNGDMVRRAEPALAAGEPAALRRLVWLGLTADALRSLAVTAVGLAAVALVRWGLPLSPDLAEPLAVVAVAGGVWSGLHGALRRSGGKRLIGLGLALGALAAWLR